MHERKPCEYCSSTKTTKDNESCAHCGAPRLQTIEKCTQKTGLRGLS